MHKIKLLLKYIGYLYRSRTKYSVHPPFIFHLVTLVFEDNNSYSDYFKIEDLKQELIKSKQIIDVIDLGAGSQTGAGTKFKICEIVNNSSKQKKHGRLLYRLVNYLKPEIIIELGTSVGLSSAYLGFGAPSSKVITVEGCPNIAELARKNFIELQLHNFSLINGSFDHVLPDILNSVDKVDFVFIDGNHREEPTIKYFEQCLTKAVNDSVFVFDDIHWSEGMENAWNYIQNHPRVTLTIDIFFMGIVFLKKELSKQHFIIRF